MADEQNPIPDTTPNGAPQAAPAPQPPNASASTQVDIEAVRREAFNAGAAAARRAAEGKTANQPQPQRSEPAPQPNAPPDALAILKLRDDFDDATADITMSAAQKKFLRERVMAERPSDVGGYVRTFAETWGIKPATSPAPNPQGAAGSPPAPAPQSGAPTPPPAPMPAGGPPAKVITDDTPIAALSPADRLRLVKSIGVHKFKDRLKAELAASGERYRLRP